MEASLEEDLQSELEVDRNQFIFSLAFKILKVCNASPNPLYQGTVYARLDERV